MIAFVGFLAFCILIRVIAHFTWQLDNENDYYRKRNAVELAEDYLESVQS